MMNNSSAALLADSPLPKGQWIRMQRQARGWSVPELRRHLREAAKKAGDSLPSNDCLGVMIRRWEKEDGGVSERYRMHFCRVFDVPLDSFGTAPLPPDMNIRLLTPADTAPANPRVSGEAAAAARPLALDDDERAELSRPRRRYAALASKHDKLRRDLVTLYWQLMHDDENWPEPQPPHGG